MINLDFTNLIIQFSFNKKDNLGKLHIFTEKYFNQVVILVLSIISILTFIWFYNNNLGLAYNDARSHLDIGRRVVEGLKPGLAQIGSVWLPLQHFLMIPTIWNDFMWHSGLSGALISMISFVGTGYLIYLYLQKMGVGIFGRLFGIFVFIANINILYLQSTAMTELLLIVTMMAGVYELMIWHNTEEIFHLIKAAFWIFLSSLVRYDGWFLIIFASVLIVFHTSKKRIHKMSEGNFIFFSTLAGLGIGLWLLWNLLIFKDPLYFAFGPFSAHTQQAQIEQAGELATKGNLILSVRTYLYALIYNSGALIVLLGTIGMVAFWFDKRIKESVRIASSALLAPLIFNILALFMGHSVLFIEGITGKTWFNARYGVMLVPVFAIFIGYLIQRVKPFRYLIIGLILFVTFFSYGNVDAVTIDDAKVGSSQKNVTEVSGWLNKNAKSEKGFVLISVASHDAIIFSSGLPMKKYIHEGTGKYWDEATTNPAHWARWIIMRTYDDNDLTYSNIKNNPDLSKYDLVEKFPFSDIYQLKPEFVEGLVTEPILGKQK